ncbi:hypothetical protein [uncultured Shewanella sp.]|uniref:hypothetical protein n=1 Tax=uncultured Shewanella sp. TaxID=173975 RepID=UPI002604B678|nr:hypothetical protein [uncultured Shewanella sp.]
MRSTLLSSLIGASLLFTQPTQAASLSQQWTLSGFSQPESVFVSPKHEWLYVSNVNGEGKGFISKLSKDGQLKQMKWVDDLAGPTGMGMYNNHLYVVDGLQVHVIDVKKGRVVDSIQAKGAVMLNDLSISAEGQLFVSDIATGKIYNLVNNELKVWFEDKRLPHTNGLLVKGNTLIAANMASKLAQEFESEEFGSLYKIDIPTKSVQMINSSYKLGGLDGVAALDDALIVSHFPAGEIYKITDKQRVLLGTVDASSADINVDESTRTLFVPVLFNGTVTSYKISNDK